MMRRTPLKRTGFKPRTPLHKSVPNREQALMERARAAMKNVAPRAAVMGGACTGVAVPKAAPVRSEAYRRAVASLPCAYCGIEGYSQHAHENDGKGARMKVDDRRAMPLCCTRPGIEGCHVAFDQYRLVPGGREAHIALGRALAEQTRNRLNAMGLWPKALPLQQFSTGDDFERTLKNRT